MRVPRPKFDEMRRRSACQSLAEGYVNETVFFDNKEYVIVGTMSSGREGYTVVWGYEVIDIHKHQGKALSYSEHLDQVDEGLIERGYTYMKARHGKRTIVLIGKQIEFRPTEEGTQKLLF